MKKFFQKIWNWVSDVVNTLYRKADRIVDSYLPVASNIVEAIKKAIESQTFDISVEVVKSLTPDVVDKVIDKAVGLAKKEVPKLALKLEIVKSIQHIDDPNEKVREVLLVLSEGVNNEKWEKFLSGMAQEILYVLADGKITWGEAASLVEYYYQNYVKKQ